MLLYTELTNRVFARSERGRYRRMSAKTSAGKSRRPRERRDSLSLQLLSELSEKLAIVFWRNFWSAVVDDQNSGRFRDTLRLLDCFFDVQGENE